jgi:hypothetical protein
MKHSFSHCEEAKISRRFHNANAGVRIFASNSATSVRVMNRLACLMSARDTCSTLMLPLFPLLWRRYI